MKTLFQINVVANSGSTGHIAEELGRLVIASGWKSYIAYGRWACPSQSMLIRVGTRFDLFVHALFWFTESYLALNLKNRENKTRHNPFA